MIGFVVSVNGKQVGQTSAGSLGLVTANIWCMNSSRWLRKERQEFSVDLSVMQIDLQRGRRHLSKPGVRLRKGDVVTIRAIETSEVSPGKWSKWEPHDFEEDQKNNVRSQCFALGWGIDEGG